MPEGVNENEARLIAVEAANTIASAAAASTAESLRREFESGLTNVSIQVGASEKILSEKIKGVKLWGALSLLGGQVGAGLLAAYLKSPQQTSSAVASLVRALPF